MKVIFLHIARAQMTIFRIPKLDSEDERALERIREIWLALRHSLKDQPYRWTGFLQRSALARGIRGSNSIEGYLVSDDDAMAAVEGEQPFDAADVPWAAVNGYREAMTYVLRLSDDQHANIDASLVRSLHFMMMNYDLSKSPGSWRSGPIYVHDDEANKRVYEGPDATLVPGLVDELIEQLADDRVKASIRAAMAHLNLVMIHPFRDGNGRMGRCIQTLVLARAGVYDTVFCSVEEYLGRNWRAYYKVLAEVGQGKWNPTRDALPWIRFMLNAHYFQAATFQRRIRETGEVWEHVSLILKEQGIPERAEASVVEAAFGHRIRNERYRKHADVTSNLASRDLKELVKAGLLVAHGERRGRWYERSPELKELRDTCRQNTPPIVSLYRGEL
jgi:Fic family protein